MPSNTPVHRQILFCSCQLDANQVDVAQLTPLIVQVERWPEFLSELELSGLAPLFYQHVQQHGLNVERSVMLSLRALFVRHQAVAKARYQAVQSLNTEFDNADIPWVALKGLALAPSLYQEIAHRPMRDIDILVPSDRLQDAAQVLRDLGFNLPEQQPSKYMRGTHQLPNAEIKINGFTISVEIHHDAIGQDAQGSLRFEQVKDQLEIVQWQDLQLPVLPAQLMLHQLCRHLQALHPGGRLKLVNVIDVIAFAEKNCQTLDWQDIHQSQAHIVNTLRCLHLIQPLSDELQTKLGDVRSVHVNGVGDIMQSLSTVLSGEQPWRQRFELAFLPSDWWLHLYYGVHPERSLLYTKLYKHPLQVTRWLWQRLFSRLLGG